MLPEGKCRYIDGQIYPDGNFYVLDTQHIKHNGNELNSALNGISTDISNKVDKVTGKGLSTEDYTTAEKNKLSGIEDNANNYVHPTTSGNKHIPSGGSSGKILGWSADGTAAWVDPASGGGSVDTVYIGSTEYAPDANGKVTLPSYPTTLPASDVYSWAKASTKPSYNADEISTTGTTNKFVTSTEKSTWNGKIDTAGTGLSKSGTTLNHSNSVTAKTTAGAYKIKYDSSGHITGTSSLSYSDVGAASSGHSHSDYESLINYSLDNGVRNILDLNDIYFKHSTISYSADIALGKIVCSGTGAYLRIMYNVKLKAGARYKLAWTVSSISTTYRLAVYATTATNANTAITIQTNCTSTGNYTYEFTAPSATTYICFYLNMDGVSKTVSYTITNIMLAEKDFFPSSFYQAAKSNSELTAIVDSLLSRVKALEGN